MVSLVASSTTGYEPSSLRDEEAGEGGDVARCGWWMVDGMDGMDG